MSQDVETAHLSSPSSHSRPASASTDSSSQSPLSLSWVERLVEIDTTSRVPNIGLIELVRDDGDEAAKQTARIERNTENQND